ncbi:hypothetical protein [Serratia ureilytica]|uniref:hypothetical protein n=1 Tax=Serratia ureilytica TaxID=300181 RepID=UPI00254C3A1F|nr:hypothetical protein [Serratia ureilytica]
MPAPSQTRRAIPNKKPLRFPLGRRTASACRGGRQNRSTDGKNILKALKCAFNYLPETGISGEIFPNG